jgi:PhzF family phenazine biosynthesis protein
MEFFSPHGELPFAGHPTLGSVHAWLEAGGKPGNGDVVVLECGVGLVDVRRTGDTLSFCGPALRRTGPLDDDYLDRIARGLRIDRSDILDHNWVDNGPGWAAVRLASAADVLALEPDDARMGEFMLGVVGPYPEGSPQQFEVRTFALPIGVREDPVCGSVNAGIAQWLIDSGQAPPSYEVSQGAAIGRDGILSIRFTDGNVWVGRGQSDMHSRGRCNCERGQR